ncbi:hypothetical protein C9374_001661 [Naegleria lovaniensis]|uniref:Large ribosomal subunit protein mL54 n=1 Tax=Naegleria lovaniensis TaxID=51637 RepID=A0AA88GWD6_NAELO|nr:uncharacterized protein C9374_001661 [Naegleria lovaniensis]KAG2387329.1 hypothetical protein C9374_001661 [Naegleria lovaniensis]
MMKRVFAVLPSSSTSSSVHSLNCRKSVLQISTCNIQLRHDSKWVKVSSLSKTELQELIKKYGPDTPKGAKGWGLEGHELPINILKEAKNPVIKSPDKYPQWLFDVSYKPDPTLEQLKEKTAKGEQLTPVEQKRFAKLTRRAKIKENNFNRVMGIVLA